MIKPILFNTQMVAAIIDGKKTVTRRIAKELCDDEIVKVIPPDGVPGKYGVSAYLGILPDRGDGNTYCVEAPPPFAVGDILYVRETFARGRVELTDEPDGYPGQYYISQCLGENDIIFKEDAIRHDFGMDDVVWTPSIHMPKWAARLFLRVKSVKLYHLNDMTEEDAIKEGFEDREAGEDSPLERFSALWDTTDVDGGTLWVVVWKVVFRNGDVEPFVYVALVFEGQCFGVILWVPHYEETAAIN